MLKLVVQDIPLEFEHSLVSLSKWEAIHERPFFAWDDKDSKTHDQMISYFEQMLVSPAGRTELIEELSPKDHNTLVDYINKSNTATIVHEVASKPGRRENVTSELIYYWMISFNVPFEAQHWHLNRLMTLIRVCGVKNSKPQKRSSGSVAQQYREANEARKKKLGTSG